MRKTKAIFLILNLFIAIFAFSYLVSSVDIIAPCEGTSCGVEYAMAKNPSSTLTPNTGSASAVSEAIKTPPVLGTSAESSVATKPAVATSIKDYFTAEKGVLAQNLLQALAIGGGIGAIVGALAGGEDGEIWGAVAGFAGALVAQMTASALGISSIFLGGGVAAIIFILTYKKESQGVVEFHCNPWQAPIGGKDCEKCNDYEECSEYTCKSLGQACELINQGSESEKCIWANPQDVHSPIIKMTEVMEGYKILPAENIRPTGTGVEIVSDSGGCVKAFTQLEFTFTTKDSKTGLGEPSQCKIDYNLTSNAKTAFDDMSYYVGGDSIFKYNHTEKLSLPGPDAINQVAPELMNDGVYTLYLRCKDANGNFNQDAYSVRFCVEPGPDTTAPRIEKVSIPSGNPIQFNKSSLDIEVYVNEPSECKWSKEDKIFDNMEYSMDCDTEIWEMNNNLYTCRTQLTGIESRKENKFFFRCKDQPYAEESERIKNTESYVYVVLGTQPLNILSVKPANEVISGSTDSIPVFLEIKTDNGYNNGEAKCYYSISQPANDGSYIEFSETDGNEHKQRQDLIEGSYTYYLKCLDLGGNAVYNSTRFDVKVDKQEPLIVRVYKEGETLKVITNEDSDCSYSNKDCNFEIDEGIEMESSNYVAHNAEWGINKNYYIRCKDKYNNQPNPNTCSIKVRPSELRVVEGD